MKFATFCLILLSVMFGLALVPRMGAQVQPPVAVLDKIKTVLVAHDPLPREVLSINELRRLGVNSDSDLLPLLDETLPVLIRLNTLWLLDRFDTLEPSTWQRVRVVATQDRNESVSSLAAWVALKKTDPGDWQAAGELVNVGKWGVLEVIMRRLTESLKHKTDLEAEQEALVRLCFQRIKTLVATERVNMRLASVGYAVQAPPFSEPRFHAEQIDAFLASLKRAGTFSDIEFLAVFRVIKSAEPTLHEAVKRVFKETIATASVPLVKLFLWQLYYQKMADTEVGKAVKDECIRRYPELSSFCDLLGQADFKSSYFGDGETRRQVGSALSELQSLRNW